MLDARVKIFFVFTHDHDVHLRMFGLDERMVGNTRTHIGVKTERLAHGYIQTLETAALRRGDRRFEEYFGAAQRIPGARLNT